MKKREKLIGTIVLLGLVMFIIVGVLQSRKPTTLSEKEINEMFSTKDDSQLISSDIIDISDDKNNVSKEKINNIVVEIKGEINKPDVYELKVGSRINDLINIAGGITENANLENINRASILNDGSCIVIGNKNIENNSTDLGGESMIGNSTSEVSNNKININTADKGMLMTLTGVGEVKAESIISYREKNGSFNSIEELAEVSGIGIKTVEKLKESITIK